MHPALSRPPLKPLPASPQTDALYISILGAVSKNKKHLPALTLRLHTLFLQCGFGYKQAEKGQTD